MKLRAPLFIALSLVTAGFQSYADNGSSSDTSPDGSSPVTGRGHRGAMRLKPGAADKNAGTLRGSCMIVASPSNPLAGPCVNLLLVLSDAEGNEVFKTRTTSGGKFDFAAERGVAYKLVPGSKSYEVVGPETQVHGGDNVALQLRQR